MGISLGGVELLQPDPAGRVQAWFDEWLPMSDSSQICDWPTPGDCYGGEQPYYPGQPVPAPNWSRPPRPRLNSWYRPTGASRWAFGFFLCDYARLQTLPIGGAAYPITLTLEGPNGKRRSWGKCYILPPHPVSASVTDSAGLWVVPVVDERWWWQFATGFETPIDGTAPTFQSWTALFSSIGSGLGITLTPDTIPAVYLYPNSFFLAGTSPNNIAAVADAAAYSVGQRIIPNYAAYGPNNSFPGGDWISAKWSTSAARRTANLTGAYDAGALQSGVLAAFPGISSIAPSSVVVAFRISRDGLTVPDYKYPRYAPSISASVAGWTGGVGPYSATVFSTAVADISSSGNPANPDNKVSLDALAKQIAIDYYAGLWVQDQSIIGISAWQESGFDDWVEFSVGRPDGNGPGPRTRVHSTPYNQQMSAMLHYDTTTWEWGERIVGKLDGALTAGGTQTVTVLSCDGALKSGTNHLKVTEATNSTYAADSYVCAARFRDKWVVLGAGNGGGSSFPGIAILGLATCSSVIVAGTSGTFTLVSGGATGTAIVRRGATVPGQSYLIAQTSAGYEAADPDTNFVAQVGSVVDCTGGTTVTATIYTGTLGAESSSGVSVSAVCRRGILIPGINYELVWQDNGWEILNPTLEFVCRFASRLNSNGGASATATIYTGTVGSESSTGVTLTVYVRRGFLHSDTTYIARLEPGGWEIVNPTLVIRGKPAADIATDTAGGMEVWYGGGAGTASGLTISSIRNDTSCTVKASKFAYAEWADSLAGWAFDIFHSS